MISLKTLKKNNNSNIILVDGDGVMLDYNKAFKACYERAYGVELKQVIPNGYTAVREYGVDMRKHSGFEEFYQAFAKFNMWRDMPSLAGSVEAINSLVDKGYVVECLTSMPPLYEEDRLYNLQSLGFKIDKVHAVDRKEARKVGIDNPKLHILETLQPLAFIDDLLKNFVDCSNLPVTNLIWLNNEHPEEDNPNLKESKEHIDHEVNSLIQFVNMFPEFIPSDSKKVKIK